MKIPIDAVTILHTILKNQKVLTRMSTVAVREGKGSKVYPVTYDSIVNAATIAENRAT